MSAGRRGGQILLVVAYLIAITVGVVLAGRGPGWAQAGDLISADGAPWLVAAALANIAGLLVGLVSWRALLADLGRPLALAPAARIYYLGFLAKFVPGRVWTLLAHIRLGKAVGVGPGAMSAAFFLSMAVSVLCGAAVGALVGPQVLDTASGWLIIPAALVVAGLIWPGAVGRFVAAVANRVKRPLQVPLGSGRGMRIAISTQLLGWAVSGLHLWALAVALGADPIAALPLSIGGFALAVTVGGLAIFVPDGAGVREVLLVLALAPVLPLHAVGVAVLASRIICLLTEVLTAGAVVLVAGRVITTKQRSLQEAPAWAN